MRQLLRRAKEWLADPTGIGGDIADTVHHTNYYPCAINKCDRIGRTYRYGYMTLIRLCYKHAKKLGLTEEDLHG